MDFTSYDNSEGISKKLECLFSNISRPFRYVSLCLFLHGPFITPKNRWQKFLRAAQIAWTVGLSLFLLGAAVISMYKMSPVYYFVYLFGSSNSIAFSYIESVTAEFELIDRDFTSDVNKHQLPVARHYIRGHAQLLKLFGAVKGPLSVWCSAHITLNFIAIYKIFCFLYGYEYDVQRVLSFWKPALLSFLLVFALSQSIAIFYSALTLRKWILGIRTAVLKVAISERMPHEQVFSLFSLHLLDLYRQPYGLFFFGLTVIDRHFVVACFLLVGIAAVYCYQQYN
ncbi:hypothetical protein RB195_008774 [Necator americanus]|uniref:Gustatory receptor n=1 Tax=Necator americanus TaxID=51031 RepID=A0ABR1CQ82_NECAM